MARKENQTPLATAVEKKETIEAGDYRINSVPELAAAEQINKNQYKRFHGTRLIASWLPQEYYDNNSDRFGYLFPGLQGGDSVLPYNQENRNLLESLGEEIGGKDSDPAVNNSQIPAGYTYLGQFIDHDITRDVNSSIDGDQDAAMIPNMRSPSLDLDAVFGDGPGLNPFLYDHAAPGAAAGVKLLLGKNKQRPATGPGGGVPEGGPALSTGTDTFGDPSVTGNDWDLQRTADFTAIIGDARNDENLLVSQLHHAFIKFYNKVVDKVIADGTATDLFTEARKITVHHYQWMVVHDFLRRICGQPIVDKVFTNGPGFFTQRPFFMPVEFAVAAYRFGHSMIRNGYFINAPLTLDIAPVQSLAQVFQFNRVPLLPVLSNWVVDFNLYFPARTTPVTAGVRLNVARKIDTRLAAGLTNLPEPAGLPPIFKILAKRNLVRGMALRVPSGQAVANAMGIAVLSAADLQKDNTAAENGVLNASGGLLLNKTPLWYYILKESEVRENGEKLGATGATIVAETFYRMLKDDPNSYLNLPTAFSPSLPRFNGRATGDFDMTDLLNFAGVLALDGVSLP